MSKSYVPALALLSAALFAAPPAVRAQAAPGPAPAGAVHTISIATLAPAGSTWMNALDAWNRELRRRSSRTLQLRFYANGVQGDEAEVVRKIRSGRLDGGAVTAIGLGQIHRPVVAFQLPGLFPDTAALDRSRDALRGELDTAFERAGFVLLGWGDAGTDHVFATRAVHAPADLAHTRPFLWREDPIVPALTTEVGAHGVPMQVPEVLVALQTHQIDAVIASPLAVAALQWAPEVSHMNDVQCGFEIGAIIMGKAQFDALSPGDRQLLRETGGQFTQLMVRNVRRDDDATVPQLRAHGITVETPTPAERAQWDATFARVRARLADTLGGAAWIARVQAAGQAH